MRKALRYNDLTLNVQQKHRNRIMEQSNAGMIIVIVLLGLILCVIFPPAGVFLLICCVMWGLFDIIKGVLKVVLEIATMLCKLIDYVLAVVFTSISKI